MFQPGIFSLGSLKGFLFCNFVPWGSISFKDSQGVSICQICDVSGDVMMHQWISQAKGATCLSLSTMNRLKTAFLTYLAALSQTYLSCTKQHFTKTWCNVAYSFWAKWSYHLPVPQDDLRQLCCNSATGRQSVVAEGHAWSVATLSLRSESRRSLKKGGAEKLTRFCNHLRSDFHCTEFCVCRMLIFGNVLWALRCCLPTTA